MMVPVVVAALTSSVAGAPVELLHNVPSQIAVSSAVESKTIEPHQLVDGNRATAWNSASRDLVGGWIEFRVGAEVTVDEIRLIVGHTGRGKEGDYFALNHRIKRVRVLHDKVKVGDFKLDPNSRELQSIKIGRPGGVYRIEVLETVPGKKRGWRELAIAELEVWGTLPPAMQPRPHDIDGFHGVTVGTLEAPRVRFARAGGPKPTLDGLCKLYRCDPASPRMAKLAPKASGFRTVLVETADGLGYARVFAETEAGWWYLGAMSMGAYTDATYTGKVEELRVEDGLLRVVVDFKAPAGSDHARLFTLCGIAPDGSPACLPEAIGLDVAHTKYKARFEHVVDLANGYLHISRGERAAPWEWLVGDHVIAL